MTARNIAASVRQRLLNIARQRGEDFQALLTRFTLERLLYRLGQSDYRDQLVLKGALLFSAWSDEPHRSTRDLDLLCFGESSFARAEQIFREVCQMQIEEDGIDFAEDSIRCVRIKEDQDLKTVVRELNS